MSPRRTRRATRALLGALVLAAGTGLTAAPVAGARVPPADVPALAQTGSIELVSQTPTVPRGGTFELRVRTDGLPADGSLEVVLHGRVRSRSELAASMEGIGLRTQVYRVTTAIAALPVATDGSRRLTLSLDPTVAGGIAVNASGAYPVEVRGLDAAGAEITTLITHLLVQPDADRRVAAARPWPSSPPSMRRRLSSPTAPRAASPSPRTTPPSCVAALADHEDVAVTLAVRPETLDELAVADDPEHTALLDALPAAAAGRSVLALPYVDVSPDALVRAGIAAELDEQLEHGRQLLADVLRVEPSGTTWVAGERPR